jgi:hypothetical protein
MNKIVMVPIPVSPEAAEALGDDARRDRIGKLVSALVKPGQTGHDPLADVIAGIKDSAARDGLSDAEVEAELAAYNGEHRL